MPSLGVMKARIANELARTDLTTEIANAITDAVGHYQTHRFRWNEAIGTFSTIAGREYYGATQVPFLSNVLDIDTIRVTISSAPWPMTKDSFENIEYLATGANNDGDPERWCWYAEQIRFYPVPLAAQTVTVAYHAKVGLPATDADSNGWTNEAEELIRTRAKIVLLEDVIREAESAVDLARLYRREAMALAELQKTMRRLGGTGVVAAHYI